MSLKPSKTIHKALLSTTSRFVGEYESEDLLVSHAWPDFADSRAMLRWNEGPASRTALMAVFRTLPVPERNGEPLPDYTWTVDFLVSSLCVLFGKRFDNHGLVENRGYFHFPDLTHFASIVNPVLPINTHATRQDYPVPLNLGEISRIAPFFENHSASAVKFSDTFAAAARFYRKALVSFETDPEGAYLHLITAGEIFSNYNMFSKDALLDAREKEILKMIRGELKDGESIAKTIESRWMLIKRRFVKAILNHVDDGFFDRTESKLDLTKFKRDSFEKSIAAAYDLRSTHLHTGTHFGSWVAAHGSALWETPIGPPVLGDKSLAKILARAPTLIGLERVIRYCLLRFAEAEGGYVAPIPIVEPEPTTAVSD